VLEIRFAEDGTVYLAGRFDASQSDLAKARLGELEKSTRLDFSGLEYISSAGIGVLLATYKRLLDGGHQLTMVGMTPRIRNVFQYAGLDKVFRIE